MDTSLDLSTTIACPGAELKIIIIIGKINL